MGRIEAGRMEDARMFDEEAYFDAEEVWVNAEEILVHASVSCIGEVQMEGAASEVQQCVRCKQPIVVGYRKCAWPAPDAASVPRSSRPHCHSLP